MYDWHNHRLNNLHYWNTSRSAESLSTKDEFEDEALSKLAKHHDKIISHPIEIKRENSLVNAAKNRDKAIVNQEEIDKLLKGHSRLDHLNLRRKLEEDRLSRAMSMYNLSSRKYYQEPWLYENQNSDCDSVLFDYDLQNNIKKMRKQRLYADALKRPKPNDRYLDQLMLSDKMFYGEPYQDQWEKETMSWFKQNAKKEMKSKSPKIDVSPIQTNQSNNSTQRRMSRLSDEHSSDQQINKFKLPPIPIQRTEDYETWLQQQEAFKKQ